MAKKHLLVLLLCAPNFLFNSIFAANELRFVEFFTVNSDVCNAPAPDSFKITGISSNFISLGWQPAWPGALHTLDVLEKNSGGGWNSLYTFNNVPGNAYTVYNLQAGHHYRFIIATNCNNGEPSELKAIIDGIALILELTIDGRTPINPKIAECHKIPLGSNWKGFKVSYMEDGAAIENHFEFKALNSNTLGNNFFSKVQIAREKIINPIVAIDPDKIWPTCNEQILDAGATFRIARLINGGPNMEIIGWVNYLQNANPPSIQLCPNFTHPDEPWSKAYIFTALAASSGSDTPDCGDRSDGDAIDYSGIKVQNPFDEALNILLPTSYSNHGGTIFRLLNTNGQVVLLHCLDKPATQISLQVGELKAGIYFLQVQTYGNIQTIKMIKS